MEDFILFEEVDNQSAMSQGDPSGGGKGYQIWHYTAESRKLDFLGFIGHLMYEYWVDYYSDQGNTVMVKKLKTEPEKVLSDSPKFYGQTL